MSLYRLRRVDQNVLPAGQARVLAALLRVYANDGRATVRTVMDEAGLSTPSTTHKNLELLRRRGLVSWTDGLDGTLRPLVWPVSDAPRQAASKLR